MKLTEEQLDQIYGEYFNFNGKPSESMRFAVERFIEREKLVSLKPGDLRVEPLVPGEALTAQPATDYRKRLWCEIYSERLLAGSLSAKSAANTAVADFDEMFGGTK